jgi:hypothetical protein
MTETIYIATIKDYKSKIDQLIERVKKNLGKFDSLDPSEQSNMVKTINNDFKYIEGQIESMKYEVNNIKNEGTHKGFKDQITTTKLEVRKLNDDFVEKQKGMNKLDNLLLPEDVDIRMKPNSELNVQQVINKGNEILKDDGEAIRRMNVVVNQDKNTAVQIQIDLKNQKEKLEGTSKNLKEINASLKRADKNLKTMFKMYATDKLIMCLIVVIVLVIIAIIITAAVGGDKDNIFNVPHDIFVSNKNTTATATTTTSR